MREAAFEGCGAVGAVQPHASWAYGMQGPELVLALVVGPELERGLFVG